MENLLRARLSEDDEISDYWGYANLFLAAVDLDTGRELAVERVPLNRLRFGGFPAQAACSPDGRLMATVVLPAGLTYGVLPNRNPILRIWNLQKGTVIYTREMQECSTKVVYTGSLSWSPSGKYLLVRGEADTRRYLVNADGSNWREISVATAKEPVSSVEPPRRGRPARKAPMRERSVVFEDCRWAPNADVLLGQTRKGELYWLYPDGRQAKRFYAPEGVVENQADVSLILMRADGSESRVVWENQPNARGESEVWTSPSVWSSRGDVLYVVVDRRVRTARDDRWHRVSTIHVWKPGWPRLKPIASLTTAAGVRRLQLFPIADSDQALVFFIQYAGMPHEPAPRVSSGRAFLLSPDGTTRPFSPQGDGEKLLKKFYPRGFDAKGRLLLQTYDGTEIAALDIATGKVSTIYP